MTLSTTSNSGAPTKPLLFPCEPVSNESLPGFLARVAARNVLDNPAWLLRTAEIPSPSAHDLSRRVAHKIDDLAEALGVNRDDIAKMWIGEVPGRPELRSFFGAEVRDSYLVHDRRRVAPASLKSSAHHRALWMLRPLSFCAESWDVLIDTCPSKTCGRKLGWSPARGIDVCEHCGLDLTTTRVPRVPPAHRDALGFVAGLVSPDLETRAESLARIPPALAHLDSGELFELAMIFSRVTSREVGTEAAPHESLAAGAQTVLDYTGRLPAAAFFNRRINANVPPPLLRLRREAASVARSRLRAVLETSWAEGDTKEIGPVRLRRLRELHSLLTGTQAAARLGIEATKLRDIVAAGLIKGEERPGLDRTHIWFSVDAVAALEHRINQRTSTVAFRRETGLSSRAITSLIGRGFIKANTDPVVLRTFRGLQLSRPSVDRFSAAMARVLGDIEPGHNWVRLEEAFSAVPGGSKPWGRFFTLVLGGQLKGAVRRIWPTLRVEDIYLSPAGVELLILRPGSKEERLESETKPPTHVTRVEAQAYLRCNPRDLAMLIRSGCFGPEPELKAGVPWRPLVEFGAKHISTSEVCERADYTYGQLSKLLARAGIGRAHGVFWSRLEVEDAIFAARSEIEAPRTVMRTVQEVQEELGLNLQSARRIAGMSQSALAREIGVDQSWLSIIERGKSNPSLKMLVELAAALRMPVSRLVDTYDLEA